jgi:two-component system phosphate regulon sensor histidine kinase PhoR
LGLAIAQEIIHAHGGTITAQNHPETGGAWLTITIPRLSKVP